MSLIKTFVDAFKKASAPKDKGPLEHVRDEAGLGVSADTDAFDPPPPPPSAPGPNPAGLISGGTRLPDTQPIKQPPSQPTPPKEPGDQGPIEGGGGGGGGTKPSAPFDPVTIKFPNTQAQGGGTSTPPSAPFEPPIDPGKLKFPNTQAQGGGLPDAPDGGDEVVGLRRPPIDSKAEGVKLTLGSSDPEEGGEVTEAGKTELDEEFIRRMRLVDDGSTVIAGGESPVAAEPSGETTRQGTPLVQVGGGSEGSGPHPPGPGTGNSEGERISFVDRRGTQGVAEDPDAGGEVLGRRRPPLDFKAEGVEPPLGSSDPEEGGEVSEARKSDLDAAFLRRLRAIDDGAVVEGGDTPEFAEFSEEGPRRRPLTVIEEEGEDPPDNGQGPQLNPNDHGEGSGTEGETQMVGLVDRRGGATELSTPFKVEMEEILVSPTAAPGGAPLNVLEADIDEPAEGGGDGFEGVARKARPDVSPEPPPNLSAEDRSFADDMARKAGEGQKDFLKIEMNEAFISRTASDGVDGESTHQDHKGEIELARRGGADDLPDDDDFEPSSLLDLRPVAAADEMLPGLAGEVPDDADLDLDVDDADTDTDESEL